MKKIERILCPVDFSDTSERAIEHALGLAQTLRADVLLLHVYRTPLYALPQAAPLPTPALTEDIAEAVQKSLDELVERHRSTGVRLETHVAEGIPNEVITRMARELETDLIVMGTHGRTGLGRMLLGSVAERVVRTATVPVTTVPPRDT